MAYQPYKLDQKAQELVLQYRDLDVLNESHKMRATVAYGLERFWGEHLRLFIQAQNASNPNKQQEANNKGNYWKSTWKALCDIMLEAQVNVPNDNIPNNILNSDEGTRRIKAMAKKLWGDDETAPFSEADRKVVIAVLTQLCDSLVWWTQRYKKASDRNANQTRNE